jgi:hypothetical protein
VDDGACLPLVPQPAVNAPTAISTAPPATAIRGGLDAARRPGDQRLASNGASSGCG